MYCIPIGYIYINEFVIIIIKKKLMKIKINESVKVKRCISIIIKRVETYRLPT